MVQPAAARHHHLPAPHPALHDVLVTDQAGPWRAHLIQHHLDPLERAALHQTCTALRDAVLTAAPTLFVNTPLRLAAVRATRRALRLRPYQLYTDLAIDTVTQPQDLSISQVFKKLKRSRQVDGLHLATPRGTAFSIPNSLPAAFPYLSSLTLYLSHTITVAALTPKALPHLSILCVEHEPTRYNRSQDRCVFKKLQHLMDQFWSQLTGFLTENIIWWWVVDVQLPCHDAPNLRELSLPVILDNSKVQTLLQHAPQLEQLAVNSTELTTDHSAVLCGWKKVTVKAHIELGVTTEWRLPRSRDGDLVVEQREGTEMCVDMDTGCAAALAPLLQGIKLSAPGSLEINSVVEAVDDEPEELRTLLRFFRDKLVDYDHLDVWVHSVTMSRAMLDVIPELPQQGGAHFLAFWLDDQPEMYRDLLTRFPREQPLVHLHSPPNDRPPMSHAVIEQICLGCPTDRTEDRPLDVIVGECYDEEFVQSVWASMVQAGTVLPHVTMKGWN